MKTRKNKAKHGGDFTTNMQTQMTSDNSQPAPMASPQVSQPSPAPASPSAPAPAAPPSGKTSNTGIFGNLFGAVEKTAEKTAEKEMGSLASVAPKHQVVLKKHAEHHHVKVSETRSWNVL